MGDDLKSIAGCVDCKFCHPLKRTCMLGRDPLKCTTPRARRGDEQLYGRILELTPEQLAEQRRRLADKNHAERVARARMGILRDSDWG